MAGPAAGSVGQMAMHLISLWLQSTRVWGYMLQQMLADTDLVVCTLFSAGQDIVLEAINPEAIFVDEAAMTKETDLWPMYNWCSRIPLLLFGDHHQLPSLVKGPPEANQLHRQFQVSPFARFVYGGLLGILREQHRMAPDVSVIVNRVFYVWRELLVRILLCFAGNNI